MAIEIPETYGGAGASFFHAVLAVEELSRVGPVRRRPGGRPEHAGGQRAAALRQRGHQAPLPAEAGGRHRRRLRAVRSGIRQRRVRADDPRAGSEKPTATATPSAGRKLWITNGNEADLFLVFATVNPEAGYRGITAFVVERGFAGFTVGKKEDKLGIRASSTCELIFDDCRVAKPTCSARSGKGYKSAIETLNEGRIGIGRADDRARAGALAHAIKYTKERKQFGKPIAEFQAVQHQLARAAMEVEAARLTVYNAARLRDAGPAVPHGSGHLQDLLVGSRRARRVARRQSLRRQRVREGLSGREAVPRRQDRPDLRRHVEPAAADDRQADLGVKERFANRSYARMCSAMTILCTSDVP
jgi:alkylation response protein AidB-like acyl-CoA dehydrogenase